MPNINDTYASVLSGYSGSVNDRRSELLTGILAYAKPLSLNDMEAAALASLGYTGALNDAWDAYIKALGGFGISVKADYLSSTFYGNPVPFLFKASEPGAWYDPSDLTTMFQDNLGSTPVTAPGQTVGLLLDKSKNGVGTNGSSRRNLLVATATLSTQSVTVTAVAHTLSFTGTGTITLTGASIAGPLIGTGASNRVSLTFTPTAASLTLTVVGSVTLAQLEIGSTATAYQPITTSWSATLAGNHATQATSTQRPIYGVNPVVGTRNLLTYTEAFTNATWLTQGGSWSAVDANGFQTFTEDTATSQHRLYDDAYSVVSGQTYTLSAQVAYGTRRWAFLSFYDGLTTVTAWFDLLNGVKGSVTAGATSTMTTISSGVYNITLTRTAGATSSAANVQIGPQSGDGNTTIWTGTGATMRIAKYQFERGSAATAYQKVVSQYEVTEVGVQSIGYLLFDGVDDGMVTGTITPGTDKVQVFAGVRKLSDTLRTVVAEMSATIAGNAGVFTLITSSSSGPNYTFSSKGTVQTDNTVSTYTAPITNVVSALGDISGASNLIRVNGSQVGSVLTTQGTGNYLAYPLYIGRRGGSSLPFNGRIYSLIVRFGPNLTTGQITSTEKWVNSKTGAF